MSTSMRLRAGKPWIAVTIATAVLAVGLFVKTLNTVHAQQPETSSPLPAIRAGLPGPAETAMNSIDPERIRAHVRFLSHDLLEGRGTGQRGGDIAAEYIASQFALAGLKPAGENGTYMQKVPLVGMLTLPESQFDLVPEQGDPLNLRLLDDYVANNETQTETAEIDAPIVFVGYGIEAPEYHWDDYKGVDVRGKVLLMLVNEPPSTDEKFFKGKALTYYGRWTYKYEEAARRGAVGAILVHRADMASYGWDVVRNSWGSEHSYLQLDGSPKLKAAAWIQQDVARKLVGFAGKDLDQLIESARSSGFRPVALPVKLKAHLVCKVRHLASNNVVGMVPGRDAKLSRQAVVYTAHYDHLGIVPGVPGDNIYNGAADNATGTAIVLELARAFGNVSLRPPRSVLFVSVTAEEQGLLGSQYFGQHPPIPAGKIALDLNYDDLPPIGDAEEAEVSGAERTMFFPEVREIARRFGLTIQPDARPEAGHYYRSDHFSFARVGIPAFSINEGVKFAGHTREWGEQQAQDYNEHRYHQPSDEYRPEMDFSGDARMARFGFALGWKAAARAGLISWQPGDEFEAARKKSQGQE